MKRFPTLKSGNRFFITNRFFIPKRRKSRGLSRLDLHKFTYCRFFMIKHKIAPSYGQKPIPQRQNAIGETEKAIRMQAFHLDSQKTQYFLHKGVDTWREMVKIVFSTRQIRVLTIRLTV